MRLPPGNESFILKQANARNPKKSTTDYTDNTDIVNLNRIKLCLFYIRAISAIRGKVFVFYRGF